MGKKQKNEMSILSKIENYKRMEIEAAKAKLTTFEISRMVKDLPATKGFRRAIEKRVKNGQTALIAEIKRASPSKGLIRPDFDVPSLAKAYLDGGACCLSVLTDEPSFQGSAEYLKQARQTVDLPLLRKDFLYDPYQVYEARVWGADCILIIMAAVDDQTAVQLADCADQLSLDVLIEVHNAEELERALPLHRGLIGINNRNLNNFVTDLKTSEELAPMVPKDAIIVSESGFSSALDIKRMNRFGVYSFLIGESLMRKEDVTVATRDILSSLP